MFVLYLIAFAFVVLVLVSVVALVIGAVVGGLLGGTVGMVRGSTKASQGQEELGSYRGLVAGGCLGVLGGLGLSALVVFVAWGCFLDL